MPPPPHPSRRRFLALSAASAAAARFGSVPSFALSQAGIPPPSPPSTSARPLLASAVARPLRYRPENGAFVIHNGPELFNRPLYGPVSSFRVDAGDRPEFSLYLPGHGGNLRVGFITSLGGRWAIDAADITARYLPGRMLYEIRDRLLGAAVLALELVTAPEGSGLILKASCPSPGGTEPRVTLAWAFAGASGRKGKRNGDIGCEDQPVSQFFQVRPEECLNNDYTLAPGSARLHSPAGDLLFIAQADSALDLRDFSAWNALPFPDDERTLASPQYPILTGTLKLTSEPVFLLIRQTATAAASALPEPSAAPSSPAPSATSGPQPSALFTTRSAQLVNLTGKLTFDTPDPFLNAAAPALAVVADALWDPNLKCVMHGCVAWRVPLAGWRGPYILDCVGNHDRTREQIRHWLARQNTSPITTGDPAESPADPNTRLARKEHLLHSNGDLSNNHYDMNLVFFDVLFRHLRWTGDLDFARECWPAIQRHLAWEHRLFRRLYKLPGGTELPLYEAYAAIWASDNLQYSGGGATHSSAYNLFALRSAATLARLLGEDPKPYAAEADLLAQGMHQLLWLPHQGAFAESKDLLGPQTTYSNPALWTAYHAIDSEVPTPREAWQLAAERLAALKPVPVTGPGVPPEDLHILPCSNWLPYQWSLNLLLMGENSHFALALFQAGMREGAWRLLKGNLLDSMYLGLCPGDFHMTSALDPHRGESQRDFGDPAGITARALLEGLFGLQPNLLANTLTLRPGFPAAWNQASLTHPDFTFIWHRDGLTEHFELTSRFPKKVPLTLLLPARTTSLPRLTGAFRAHAAFDPEAVGSPVLKITVPAADNYKLTLTWHGTPPPSPPPIQTLALGGALALPPGIRPAQLEDPQLALTDGRASSVGFHTVFAPMRSGVARWALPISFRVEPPQSLFNPIPSLAAGARPDPLDLGPALQHNVTEIFTRGYKSPRSPFCSLSVPDDLLGGWANIAEPAPISDAGLRAASGTLQTPLNVSFRTPASGPNCLFLSFFEPDATRFKLPLTGRARGLYLLLTGTTLPQASRMVHALVTVTYTDGSTSVLPLRNPETWWPIEQDYLLDDFLFVDPAPLPPRVDLHTGQTRLLDLETFKGKGGPTSTGQATILHLPLDPTQELQELEITVTLYNIVVSLLAATLARPTSPPHTS